MAAQQHMIGSYAPAGYPDDLPMTPGSNMSKRKASTSESGNASASRAKRARYISVACNECKRRKIKCNGQTPCQRCGNLSLECVYASNNACSGVHLNDSEEFQQMQAHVARLQDQVNFLYANLPAAKTSQSPGIAERHSQQAFSPDDQQQLSFNPARARPGPINGPISAAYGLDVAKHSLASMGINPESGSDGLHPDQPSPERSIDPELTAHAYYEKDPLWSIKRDDALRLLKQFDEEIGVTYPMLDMAALIESVNLLYNFIDAAIRTGFMPGSHVPGADAIDDEGTNVIKMVLANILTFENSDGVDVAHKLFKSVEPHLEKLPWMPATMTGIKLVALSSMWYFHQDNEVMSWRLAGIAGRMCMELGLHRKATLERQFASPDSAAAALKLFWTIHSFDRRWSVGTGLPFCIPDADIDPQLPIPTEPYPKAMYDFHNLIAQIWYSQLRNEAEPRVEEMDHLDCEICEWYDEIAPELRLDKTNLEHELRQGDRGMQGVRLLVYMRTNFARLSIYRPVLQSATSIVQNKDYAQRAVNLAKDIISLLSHVNQISDIYRTQQTRFNPFLLTALAALFLAVCHAPAEFHRDVQQEFYMALELIKGFNASSPSSKRLWKTISQLQALFRRLEAFKADEASDPHSTAALAMAGLAGQPIDGMGYGNQSSGLGSSPLDGQRISNELDNLFQYAGGQSNGGPIWSGAEGLNGATGASGQYPGPAVDQTDAAAPSNATAYQDEFSKIMSQIF